MPPRTLLVYTSGRDLADDYFARKIPVGLGLLNAVLNQAGFPSQVGNFSRFSPARIRETLRREKPDLLGLSVFTFNRHASHEVASLARELDPRCTIVAGGPHVTHLDRHWLEHYPAFDAVVRGEGEETLLEIAARLGQGRPLAGTAGSTARAAGGAIEIAPPRPVIDDLDRLPHGADHLARSIGVDVAEQLRYFISSRGCPGACTFCNTPDFWGKRVRFRSVGDVMAELKTLRERHGLLHVSFRDDTFTANRPRTLELCQRLVDSRFHFLWECQSRVNLVDEERLDAMKRAGCQAVQYGIESGSDRILKVLQKDISVEQIRAAAAATRRAGLGLSIYLITGVPEETPEDIAATRELIREILPHDGIVAPLAVYPGTRLYESSKRYLGVSDAVWVKDTRDALYVREDPEARASYQALVAELEATGRAAAYGPADYAAVEARLGFTFAGALHRSEYHRARGEWSEAVAAAEAIRRHEPGNPWGPLRLADLQAERGDARAARSMREEAQALIAPRTPRSRRSDRSPAA